MEYTPYEQLNPETIDICRKTLLNTLAAVQKMEALRDANTDTEDAVRFMELFTSHTNNYRLAQTFSEMVNLCERVVVQISVILQFYVAQKGLTPILRSSFQVLVNNLDMCETILKVNQEILGENYAKYDVKPPSHYDKVTAFIGKRQVMREILAKHAEQNS